MDERRVEELLEHLYVSQVEGSGPMGRDFAPEVYAATAERGCLVAEGDGWRLTEWGRQRARDVVRRHRLAERLLRDVLNVCDPEMEQDACRFEHILLAELEAKVCGLLGHPSRCPHGKPIPEGACCRLARSEAIREVRPLGDGEVGQRGTVAYLSTRSQEEVRKLMAMGILPGVKVRLLRRFPSYVFQVEYSQFTVDRALAEKIYVHWLPEDEKAPPDEPGHGRRRRHGRRGSGAH